MAPSNGTTSTPSKLVTFSNHNTLQGHPAIFLFHCCAHHNDSGSPCTWSLKSWVDPRVNYGKVLKKHKNKGKQAKKTPPKQTKQNKTTNHQDQSKSETVKRDVMSGKLVSPSFHLFADWTAPSAIFVARKQRRAKKLYPHALHPSCRYFATIPNWSSWHPTYHLILNIMEVMASHLPRVTYAN